MRSDYSDITVVLDRSGSMESVKQDTVGGFNNFLKEQQAVPGDCTFTLVQFDTVYEFVYSGVPIRNVPPLNGNTFVPRGGTALLDAVGRAINETGARLAAMPEPQRPGKVVFVILTDGQENSSQEFNRQKVFEMISRQRSEYKWEFVFLGANQDAIQAGASIGIANSNAITYANNAVGTRAAFASAGSNVAKYRVGAKLQADFEPEDRQAQRDAGAQS